MEEFANEFAYNWFHTPTPIEKAGGLWPIRAGKNLAKPHYKIGPRMISYYSLHFVLEGEGVFTFDQNEVSISAGDVFCLFPNKTHVYRTLKDNPLQMVWLAFDGKQAKSILQKLGITDYSPYAANLIDPESKKVLLELLSTTTLEDELTRLSKIYELFGNLSKNVNTKNLPSQESNWIMRSIEFMETHYGEGITVDDVAKFVGLHRSYFTTKFTLQMHKTPKRFLTDCKMNLAAKMIEENYYTITEIAHSLGYSDLYSFSKAFKNYFGVSPKHYC